MKCRFCVRDPGSAATHFLGFLIVIPVFVVLLREAFLQASIAHLIGFSIFGLSLLLLYGASTVYHTLVVSEEKQFLLRQIDHIMIFVLIAGTYTPICLISLQGVWGFRTIGTNLDISCDGNSVEDGVDAGATMVIYCTLCFYGMVGSHCPCASETGCRLEWNSCIVVWRGNVYRWRSDLCFEETKSQLEALWIS